MRVFCAVDGSAGSDTAIQQVGQLLSPERDEIVLYYVPPPILAQSDQDDAKAACEALVAKVFEHARSLLSPAFFDRTTTVVGDKKARVSIPAAAAGHGAELVALGARSNSRIAIPRLGSVCRAVVHSVDVPVLVARPRQRAESEAMRIFLCSDRTHLNETTIALLKRLTLADDTDARVVHVIESLARHGIPEWWESDFRLPASFGSSPPVDDHQQQTEHWREQLLAYSQQLPEPFQKSDPVFLEGHPGEQIVEYATSQEADLLVVGARVQGAISKFLGGSTSEHVLSAAGCSVLIVPHRQ